MYCPKCGTSYEEHETLCSNCGLPLANATFVEVKKKRRWPWILLVLVLLLMIGGVFAYQYYLNYVEKECLKVTNEIFTYAHDLDFSAVDPAYLPEELKGNPNIRLFVKERVQDYIEESNLLSIVNMAGITIDTDAILDDIIEGASYEIVDVNTDYRSCTITLKTSNTDYGKLPETIYNQVMDEMKNPSHIWDSIKKKLSSLFYGDDEKAEPDSPDDNSLLSELYEKARTNCPKLETKGQIVYGIKDGTWTLISLDEDLFYSYYGITKEMLNGQ